MNSRDYFEKVAKEWERMREQFFSENVRETAYKSAGLESGKIAVDLGAGSGFITEGLLEKGLRVIAIDQSPKMLEELKRRFSEYDNLETVNSESADLKIEDSSVDYVFANMYLHHVESPPLAIDEIYRILKPGGKILISDLEKHKFELLVTEQHDHWMGFERSDIFDWYEKAGFSNINIEDIGENCCAQSQTGDCETSINIIMAVGVK